MDKEKDQERTEQHSWWGVTGLFSGLRGRRSHDGGSHGATAWTEGEVHADLVRVRRKISQLLTQPRCARRAHGGV